MLKNIFLFLLFAFLSTGYLLAQNAAELKRPQLNFYNARESEVTLSGNLRIDQKLTFDAVDNEISKIEVF